MTPHARADGSNCPDVDQLRKECAAEKTRKAVNKDHKGLYSALSKVTKSGTKVRPAPDSAVMPCVVRGLSPSRPRVASFWQDVSTTPTTYAVGDLLDDALLKAAIANHLLREGRLPAARALIQVPDCTRDTACARPGHA